MSTKTASAKWNGSLMAGSGHLKTQSGKVDTDYGWKARSEDGQPGTNPEELIGAAHAGCFSMALAHMLTAAGFEPKQLDTKASVTFDKVGDGFAITGIKLELVAEVPKITDADFQKHAAAAKAGCPVSKALASVPTTLDARLKT